MVDVLTKAQRSYNMAMIRAKNTIPERKLRQLLRSNGIRGYRLHCNLPGKPDIVFLKNKIVIFIDGCFWHRCSQCFTVPATRREFWMKKIHGNVKRDRLVTNELKESGWFVIRLWEHEVKRAPAKCVRRIVTALMRRSVRK
jgi:DNA mismatch endonuclease (patch repair protein)